MSVNYLVEHLDTVVYKLRFVFAGTFVIVVLLLFLVLLSALTGTVEAKGTKTSSDALAMHMSNSPNAVTGGLTELSGNLSLAADEFVHTMNETAVAAGNGAQAILSATARGTSLALHAAQTGVTTAARAAGKSILFVGRTVGSGIAAVGRAVGSGVVFVVTIPSKALGYVSNASVARAVIQPADHEEIPIIDPESPALRAALAALPAESPQPAAPQSKGGPIWPMHGRITTQFGVPHRPYQHTHTGIDISDNQRPGITPIKPFRPGRVIEVIHSRQGLGNHVIVDHGSGVTSVYAHLHTIAVQVGQEVGIDTTLGLEGTTGVSTGTHLHFEIRVDGQAADPRQFIPGQP